MSEIVSSIIVTMTGREFIERVSEIGRKRGISVRIDAKRGKGSHVTLYYGNQKTVMKDRRKEIGAGLLSSMIRELGLDREDFSLVGRKYEMRFTYPALLKRFSDDEIVVSFRDLPECRTAGSDHADALAEAQDALSEAIAGRIDDNELIPEPSALRRDEHNVAVPTDIAAKAALVLACRSKNLSLEALAGMLGTDKQAVARMLDPRQSTDTDNINRALHILGSELVLEVRALASVSSK